MKWLPVGFRLERSRFALAELQLGQLSSDHAADRRQYCFQTTHSSEGRLRLLLRGTTAFSHSGRITGQDWSGGDDGADDGDGGARPPRPVRRPHRALRSRKGELSLARIFSYSIVT